MGSSPTLALFWGKRLSKMGIFVQTQALISAAWVDWTKAGLCIQGFSFPAWIPNWDWNALHIHQTQITTRPVSSQMEKKLHFIELVPVRLCSSHTWALSAGRSRTLGSSFKEGDFSHNSEDEKSRLFFLWRFKPLGIWRTTCETAALCLSSGFRDGQRGSGKGLLEYFSCSGLKTPTHKNKANRVERINWEI